MTHLDGVHLKGQETEDKGRPRQAVWTCSQEEERHKRIRKITAARLPRVWDSGGLVHRQGRQGRAPATGGLCVQLAVAYPVSALAVLGLQVP